MRRALTLAIVLLAAAPASGQEPSVSYSVTFESPSDVATGELAVRIRVAGGVRSPEGAAYHVSPHGGWSQADSFKMQPAGEGVFEDTLITEALPNDRYQIEVRVWADVPPYNPNDPRTFARATTTFAIDNAPEAPDRLEALTPASWLRVGWEPVETSDREDFLGYVVYVSRFTPCPPELAAYTRVALVTEPLYEDPKLAAAEHCVRVASARRSAVSSEILSPPTAPVRVAIARSSAGAKVTESGGLVIRAPGGGRGGEVSFEVTEKVEPPGAPALPEGDPVIADGSFAEDLPYGPRTVTQRPGGWPTAAQGFGREAGVDPKRTATLFAGGLVLATAAALVRRFVTAAPR